MALGALAAYAGADLALQRLSPLPPRITEVDDGVDAYQAGDPDIAVLGSSHARSFEPLRDLLARPENGGHRVVVVPAEWGTFTAYNWVLRHRLARLIDERDSAGLPVRGRLRRALLITTFYDMCKITPKNVSNLPARAWAFEHFVEDVLAHGITDYNRNYVQTRWRRLLARSVLVQNRGYDRIEEALHHLTTHPDLDELRRLRIEGARQVMEEQYGYCDDPDQKRELAEMIDFLLERKVEVSVVLFPLMPAIVSDQSRRTTLPQYADHVAALARSLPIRVVDLTSTTPMEDADFMEDFDHLTLAGNRKFSVWALDHDLAFLKAPAAAVVSAGPPASQPLP